VRRGSGRGSVERVALQETGTMLGDLLRRALAERLAQAAVVAEGPTQPGRQAGDRGGASGRGADVNVEGGVDGRTGVDGEGAVQ
jgi:hypothetical protein